MINPDLPILIANTRALAFIVNDDSISDDDVTQRLTEALSSLHDLVVGAYEHYSIKQFPFTLAGGNAAGLGLNSVTLPTDFYKDNSVDRVTSGSSQPETVHRFEWLDRNRTARREYSLLGSTLVVNPINRAQGNYVLYYTPLAPSFGGQLMTGASVIAGTAYTTNPTTNKAFLNTPTTFHDLSASFDASFVGRGIVVPSAAAPVDQLPRAIVSISTPLEVVTSGPDYSGLVEIPSTQYYVSGPSSSAIWNLPDIIVDASLLGATIIVAGSNWSGNNDTFTITSLIDDHHVTTNNGSPLTETFNTAVSVLVQPVGTIYKLSQIYAPWYEYLQVHAAIACRDSMDLPTEAQERNLAALTKRIEAMAANRMEEPGQVALTHHTGGGWDEGGYLP